MVTFEPSTSNLPDGEIPVVKTEQFATFRQVIRPKVQSEVHILIVSILRHLRLGRFTGRMTIEVNQGGVREIVTEQKSAHIPEGTVADKAIEKEFSK